MAQIIKLQAQIVAPTKLEEVWCISSAVSVEGDRQGVHHRRPVCDLANFKTGRVFPASLLLRTSGPRTSANVAEPYVGLPMTDLSSPFPPQ